MQQVVKYDDVTEDQFVLRNTSMSGIDLVDDEKERKVSLLETILGIGILLVAIVVFFIITAKRDS